jgi:hypothetical protein
MDKEKPTYLMLRRDLVSQPDMDFTEQHALIVYTILFNGPIIASDSDLIINPQLRNSILNDSFVQSLVDSGYIQFAVRSEEGVLKPLSETSLTILQNKGHNPLIPDERHGVCPEFNFVEDHGTILAYSHDGAVERYEKEVLRILHELSRTNAYVTQLYPDHAKFIIDAIQKFVENGGKLTWSFFGPNSDLWNLICQSSPKLEISQTTKRFLSDAMRGPYATFLPETLKVSPTYSKEDSLGIDIWRGRYLLDKETITKQTFNRARISLVDYVAGLTSLTLNDIQELRQSGERVAYDAACIKFSRTLKDVNEPIRSLHEYRRRIDSKILERINKKADTDTESIQVSIIGKKIHEFQDSEVGQWVKFGVVYAADQFTFGSVSLLDFLLTRFQHRQQEKAVDELHERSEVDKEIAIQEFQQLGSHTLEGKAIIDQVDIRDFCTDVV